MRSWRAHTAPLSAGSTLTNHAAWTAASASGSSPLAEPTAQAAAASSRCTRHTHPAVSARSCATARCAQAWTCPPVLTARRTSHEFPLQTWAGMASRRPRQSRRVRVQCPPHTALRRLNDVPLTTTRTGRHWTAAPRGTAAPARRAVQTRVVGGSNDAQRRRIPRRGTSTTGQRGRTAAARPQTRHCSHRGCTAPASCGAGTDRRRRRRHCCTATPLSWHGVGVCTRACRVACLAAARCGR